MEVKNCRMCRRLFNYLGGPNICPECKDELERKFIKVRDYIRENPTASLQQVADEVEINVQQIRDWIREGRLEVSKESPNAIKCEKCGAPILKGRFCDKCSGKMADSLNQLIKGEEDRRRPKKSDEDTHGNKMRFRRD